MNKTNVLYLLLIILTYNAVIARTDKTSKNTNKGNFSETTLLPQINSSPFASEKIKRYEDPADYSVLNSNNSYVEFEFTPKYTSNTEFLNAVHDCTSWGKPDLGSRNFPVITPGDVNNLIEILDIKFEELTNVEVNPIPSPQKSENDFNLHYDYKYDNTIYTSNTYFPKVNAEFKKDGIFRNKYFGVVQIYPVQFIPLRKVIRRVTYIKIRVKFGTTPVYSVKPQSKAERDFLRNISLNWESAIDWSTPEANSYKPKLQSSILASGDFYKIEVKETGIYKIDKNYLEQAGINTSNIDPRTIKIYGNGGRELPYLNSEAVAEDLIQNPIYVSGEADGVFNDGDYLLFYGLSPHQWIKTGSSFAHKLNPYSNSNYYWITFGGVNGRRIQEEQSQNNPNITPLDHFTDKLFIEPEVNNLGSTGNLWVSQRIGYGESLLINKQLDGYIPGSVIDCKLKLGNGTSRYEANFSVSDNNSGFSNVYPVAYASGLMPHINLTLFDIQYSLTSGSALNLNIRLSTTGNVTSVSGYYDYLEAFYTRSMNSAINNFLKIVSPDTMGTMEYSVSPYTSSTVKVFRITSQNDIQIINPISYSGGVVRFQDNTIFGRIKEYIVTGDNGYRAPASISGKIPNQNIRGMSEGADFVIITPADFIPAANRMKTQKESPGTGSPNYLKTVIVDINQIYNEFSGGLTDPVAIRNFLKYAYNNWVNRPVYVLFLGDGSYDYKNIYALNLKNQIPAMEKSDIYMDEVSSYNSDDFLTDINEEVYNPEPVRTDFASGRFCVNSIQDANAIVDKVIQYESNQNTGNWKKKIMYCADDGWTTEGNDRTMHTDQCELLAEAYTTKDFEKEKIYIVAYPTVITPQGRRKPDANKQIIKGWNEGRLLINWTGHGSTDLWAHEHVFVRNESIPQMKNKNTYPIVTIASCDLARWDDPFTTCASEQLVYLKEAGAIGVIAATRPVFADANSVFNNLLWSNIMFHRDTLNLPLRMGKVIFNVKNQLGHVSDNDMKFCLIGDPTLRIGIPQNIARVDSINSKTNGDTAIVKSLQKMRISGSVLKSDSTFWNTFNGVMDIKVLDVDRRISIIDFQDVFNFRLDGGTIFKGTTNVINGKWSIEFIIPKDISYSEGNGKIIEYFKNESYEGSGYSDRFIMSGIDTNAVRDTLGPDISLFMDNRNFRSGDIVNQNAKLIADLHDDSGINLTGTIGHKIEAVINDNDNNKIDLTQQYNSTNGYQYGTIEYGFDGLPDGNYTLKLRAWDTYNNFSDKSIYFTVRSSSSLVLSNVFNYPNPMKDFTSFIFQHNFDVPLSAEIYIYSVAGRKIQTIRKSNIVEKNVLIEWDGKDADGDFIANGTYIYKLNVKTEDGLISKIQTGKLAKLK